jgi:ActR/RegA family two-component response regulator
MFSLIADLVSGKKTYISLIVLTLTLISGINVTENDVQVVLTNFESIIAAVSIIAATISRAVAKPKSA